MCLIFGRTKGKTIVPIGVVDWPSRQIDYFFTTKKNAPKNLVGDKTCWLSNSDDDGPAFPKKPPSDKPKPKFKVSLGGGGGSNSSPKASKSFGSPGRRVNIVYNCFNFLRT